MKNLQPMRHGPRTITTRHYLIGLLVLVSLLVASPALAGKLHKAVEKGDLDKVERLIAKGGDVNAIDKNGLAPLHIAADKGHKAVAGLLIAKGANVNATIRGNPPLTPLHIAAKEGYAGVVELLIAGRANVNSGGEVLGTPLHGAAVNGHSAVVRLLIDRGAEVNAKAHRNYTPLHWTAFKGHTAVAQLLVDRGAEVNAKTVEDSTPLHIGAANGHKDFVALLIAEGADINWKDKNGRTSLHFVASNGHTAVAALLIAKGADVNAKEKDGTTPLRLATVRGHKDLAKLLKQHGADQPAGRKRAPAQVTGAFGTYTGHQHQFLIDLPPGWSVYDQRKAITGKAIPIGMVIFSEANIAEMNAQDQGKAFSKIGTGELPSFFVDRHPKEKKMSCSYFGKKEVKKVLKMLTREPITGRHLKVIKALETQPITIGRCKGYRIRGEIQLPSGTIYVNDVHVVSDGKILYLFALRNTRENYESNLGLYEKAISTVQLTATSEP